MKIGCGVKGCVWGASTHIGHVDADGRSLEAHPTTDPVRLVDFASTHVQHGEFQHRSAVLDEINRVATRMVRSLMRHRDRYLKAWIAATGHDPRECEMVEERMPMNADGALRVVVYFRKRDRCPTTP